MTPSLTSTTETLESIEKLHTRLVDVIHGFDEALERAEPDVRESLRLLRDQHVCDADEIGSLLRAFHGDASKQGSWMSTVQKAVIHVRAWVTGIGEGVLPAVARGEQSLLECYDEAILASTRIDAFATPLRRQRTALQGAVADLESSVIGARTQG